MDDKNYHELGNLLHQIINYSHVVEENHDPFFTKKIRECAFGIDALISNEGMKKRDFSALVKAKDRLKNIDSLEGLKVLVVDDMQENRMFLKRIFSMLKCEVFEAVDGEDAIKQCAEHLPDIVTMDIVLKSMDGTEATKIIKNQGHSPYIIAVSALKGCSHKEISLFDVWLPKPFTMQHILDALSPFIREKDAVDKKSIKLKGSLSQEEGEKIRDLVEDGAISELEYRISILQSSELREFLEAKLEYLDLEAIVNATRSADAR